MNAVDIAMMDGFTDCIVKQANPTTLKKILPHLIPRTLREGMMLGSGLAIGVPSGVALVTDKNDNRFSEKSRQAGHAFRRGAKEFVRSTVKGEDSTEKRTKESFLSKAGANDTAFDATIRGAGVGAALGMAANVASRLPRALRKKLLLGRLVQGSLVGGLAGAGGGLYEHSRLSKKLDQKPTRHEYYHFKNLPTPERFK